MARADGHDALGVDFAKRGALLDEAIEVIRMAWSGQVVVKKGINFDAAENLPRPAPDPQPPIKPEFGSRNDADRYLEQLREFSKIGVTWATTVPPSQSMQACLEYVQWFGQEIVARI